MGLFKKTAQYTNGSLPISTKIAIEDNHNGPFPVNRGSLTIGMAIQGAQGYHHIVLSEEVANHVLKLIDRDTLDNRYTGSKFGNENLLAAYHLQELAKVTLVIEIR